MADHLRRGAFHHHRPVMDDIGAINNIQHFAHIMIGYKNPQPMSFKLRDQIANIGNRDRVNSGQRLIQ